MNHLLECGLDFTSNRYFSRPLILQKTKQKKYPIRQEVNKINPKTVQKLNEKNYRTKWPVIQKNDLLFLIQRQEVDNLNRIAYSQSRFPRSSTSFLQLMIIWFKNVFPPGKSTNIEHISQVVITVSPLQSYMLEKKGEECSES